MPTDVLQIVGGIIILLCAIYVVLKMFNMHVSMIEGLTTMGDSSGDAGSAENYAAKIKAKSVQLQDKLLITKYRASYENVILDCDEFVSLTMLEMLLNLDLTDDVAAQKSLIAIGQMGACKTQLNQIMKYVDGVK